MQDSITTEAEWLGVLDQVPAWTPPLISTIIVAPHPDDETLATGGMIRYLREREVRVRVVAVTDGEASYPDSPGLGSIRSQEQEAALAELGIPQDCILRLHLPDSNVAASEKSLVLALADLVSADCHLVAPWQHDWHPDHEACGRAAVEAASRKRATLSSWFFWTWPTATPDVLRPLNLRSLPLHQATQAAKERALACHQSQLHHASGHPILTESVLAPARRPFEVFAIA